MSIRTVFQARYLVHSMRRVKAGATAKKKKSIGIVYAPFCVVVGVGRFLGVHPQMPRAPAGHIGTHQLHLVRRQLSRGPH